LGKQKYGNDLMSNIQTGDVVRMKPKYYGPGYKDQWAGITGIVLEIVDTTTTAGAAILVQHPEESTPIPIFAFLSDVEKLVDPDPEYCDYCECTPCDCNWGN